MATDFFENQDRARKKTGRLVVLFALAVLAIIMVIIPGRTLSIIIIFPVNWTDYTIRNGDLIEMYFSRLLASQLVELL